MVRTPSWPIEMKLPSGSCRRKGAGTASLPFSSTRTRCVPQNIHVAYLESLVSGRRTAAAGNGGCWDGYRDRCREEGFDVG